MARWIAALVVLSGCMGAPNDKDATTFITHEDGRETVTQVLPKPAAFDGKRAMDYLNAICAIGPRISGTQGMKKQQELLRKHFEELGLKVTMQELRCFKGHRIWLTSLAFSPDGKMLLTASNDASALIWDVSTLR